LPFSLSIVGTLTNQALGFNWIELIPKYQVYVLQLSHAAQFITSDIRSDKLTYWMEQHHGSWYTKEIRNSYGFLGKEYD
jgi:hypothetical protein